MAIYAQNGKMTDWPKFRSIYFENHRMNSGIDMDPSNQGNSHERHLCERLSDINIHLE